MVVDEQKAWADGARTAAAAAAGALRYTCAMETRPASPNLHRWWRA
ncbi:hypothetical protein MYA_5235 [Burkholderia sp. KJ006]|nr:hypothetical protein MYA_5235 [Burkholderia sp. KJ006]